MYVDEFNKGGSCPLLIHPLGIHQFITSFKLISACYCPHYVSFSHMVLFLSLGVDSSDYNFHVYAAIDHLWQWITVGYVIVKFYNMPMIFTCSVFSCDQAALRTPLSVGLSVCLSVCHTFLTMFVSSYRHKIFRSYYQWQKVMSMQKVKVIGQRSRSQRS